jgi:protein-disulfide isomerase
MSRSLAPLILLLLAVPACAQQPAPRAQDAARQTTMAAAAAEPDSVLARASRSRSRGAPDAPVTIIEVSDFQCPFCRQFAAETHPALDSAYLQTGKARLVFINYPLPNHAQAWAASEAALCAGAQDAFWPMHDQLFRTQPEWSGVADATERFVGYAAAMRLDERAFRTCVERDQVAPLIIGDLLQSAQAGIGGTPTFVLQPTAPGREGNRQVVVGAQPFAEMSQRIEAVLAGRPAP